MRDLELLDIIAIISLYYQSDSAQILRSTANLDDLTKENGEYLKTIVSQNKQIIALLKEIRDESL